MSTPGLWQAPNGQGNPDNRPLPPGFVTQFDPSYNTWFYINTQANPPRSQWLHPVDHHDQNNPPPGGVNWNALAPSGGTPGGGYSPGPGPAYRDGQGGYNPGMQQGYPPPPVQQKSSSNTGAIVAAGAVGIVGGALIANAMSDDDDYQDGYEAGLEAAEEEN
ncbi:Got1 domain protein [Rhizoctonia solani 123E]|uniref:Got1 domain protein n=1 Tax=Rhizoctonia solani 123E TaxID=1423351 RepID=A0A074SXQ4_9AGAM|nr:Got1 domain protein [Rhizoctonia solani 123E]